MSFFRKSINGQTCTFTGEKQLVLQREDVDLRHNNRAVIFFMGAYDKKKKKYITWTCQYQNIMLYECCLYRHGIWIIQVQCSLAAFDLWILDICCSRLQSGVHRRVRSLRNQLICRS